MEWIIESSVSLSLFYLAYLLFLRKLTLFRANRYFLLSAIVFSLAVPHISLSPPVTFSEYNLQLREVIVTAQTAGETTVSSGRAASTAEILFIIYLSVAALLTARFALHLTQLAKLTAKGKSRKYKNARIVSLESENAPFSFLNYIFINENLYSEKEKEKVIQHEMVHIRQLHTLDLILMEILTIVQWFNPFAWLCRKSLIEIHEYLADDEMLNSGTGFPGYLDLLKNVQLSRVFFSPANNLNKSLTLNRIKMMKKEKPPAWKRIRFFLLFPALAAVVFMCTFNDVEKKAAPDDPEAQATGTETTIKHSDETPPPPPSPDPETARQHEVTEDEEVFVIVEDMPTFQGESHDHFIEWISDNLRYPEEAREEGVHGRVIVQFIVEADGNISNVEVVSGVHPLIDEEAVRVIESSPGWEPGRQRGETVRVRFTFPIHFVLDMD